MSLGTTSSCQDSQNQLFVKNVKKLVTTKGHVKEGVKVKIPSFQGNNDPKVP